MKFTYDFDRLSTFLTSLLKQNLSPQAWQWLEGEGNRIRGGDVSKFNSAFVVMPRKTGKDVIRISAGEADELRGIREGFSVTGWPCDRLARVWLLMMLDPGDERYAARIEELFLSAEMAELVALYAALPVLAYPESWRKRCAEGIRSNIGQVLEAVICNNPYPAEQLDDTAWNQLVLKAIFTEKPVLEIVGLKERRNAALAASLCDYAHERWAAHRDVNPLLWICVAPFVNEQTLPDLERLMSSPNPHEREAAALVCYETEFAQARQLLDGHPEKKSDIEKGVISWERIAANTAAVTQ